MIIPMTPENVRITIQLTSADFGTGAFTHDIDLQKLYDNRNSCSYEFAIDNDGQEISKDYQLFYDDGTLYATVFFPTNDGQMLKLTLTDGEGVISETEPELPAVTSAENGKVLKVVNGAWGAADAPSGLPAVSGTDNGKVLTVKLGAWAAAVPEKELPAVTSSYAGCVLTVDDLGEWVAAPGTAPEIFDGASPTTGLTLTIPSYEGAQDTVAYGHLMLFGNGLKGYSSDFWYKNGQGFQFANTVPTSGTGFRKTAVMANYLQTGAFFTYYTTEPQPPTEFSALVLWYYNPYNCTLEEGEYTPDDAPSNSQSL